MVVLKNNKNNNNHFNKKHILFYFLKLNEIQCKTTFLAGVYDRVLEPY